MPSSVDPGFASWLKAPARKAGATIAGAQTTWGDKALDSYVLSPIAYQAQAQTEAVRQAQFLAGPIAVDTHRVPGQRRDLINCVVVILNKTLGYQTGANVLVIGAEEADDGSYTTLTVLKRL